ncbi:hypothetical protein Mchl_0307 [Methylorubrum extorquens CM4]|uniref:Uncharacterized protein n=1 Tax=Methylorubrum extorquens (strain CM4 / NCIMB 13688) TaxID=440085 RepID=B7KYX2_METC4|nr:hypothetical protein Mchl_0307 [Methylorubrum extorquens CM4]
MAPCFIAIALAGMLASGKPTEDARANQYFNQKAWLLLRISFLKILKKINVAGIQTSGERPT